MIATTTGGARARARPWPSSPGPAAARRRPTRNGGTAGPDTQPPSNGCELPTPPRPPSRRRPSPVTVWEPYQGRMQTALERVVARYNAAQPQVKVVLDPAADHRGRTGPLRRRRPGRAERRCPPSWCWTAAHPGRGRLQGDRPRLDVRARAPRTIPPPRCRRCAPPTPWTTSTGPAPPPSTRRCCSSTGPTSPGPGSTPSTRPAPSRSWRRWRPSSSRPASRPSPWPCPSARLLVENWLTGAGANVVDHDNGRTALASASAFDNPRTLELYQWLHDAQAAGLVDALPRRAPARRRWPTW